MNKWGSGHCSVQKAKLVRRYDWRYIHGLLYIQIYDVFIANDNAYNRSHHHSQTYEEEEEEEERRTIVCIRLL